MSLAEVARPGLNMLRITGPLLLAGLVLLASPSPSHAFLQTLFGPPKVTRSAPTKVPEFLRPLVRLFSGQSTRRRISAARLRPGPDRNLQWVSAREPNPTRSARRVRVASVAPTQEAPDAEPTPLMVEEGIGSAFLHDATLKRGDIVVFPDGPRVFSGDDKGSVRHMGNFEDLSASGLVNEATRQLVLAATAQGTVGEPKLSFRARPRGRAGR